MKFLNEASRNKIVSDIKIEQDINVLAYRMYSYSVWHDLSCDLFWEIGQNRCWFMLNKVLV